MRVYKGCGGHIGSGRIKQCLSLTGKEASNKLAVNLQKETGYVVLWRQLSFKSTERLL